MPDPAHAGDFQAAGAGTPIRQSNLWRDAKRRYMRNKGAVVAAAIFLIVVAYCVIVPIVSPYDPNEVNFDERCLPPSLAHPFGTDGFGRDLFTRVALGGRISILIGFAATFVILVIGLDVRLDLRLRRRLAGQHDDALPRRAVRPAVPAVRDHHARDHRRNAHQVDDGARTLHRELVHGSAHRPRPDHHSQTERLRTCGDRRGGALVPRPRAASRPEHARRSRSSRSSSSCRA